MENMVHVNKMISTKSIHKNISQRLKIFRLTRSPCMEEVNNRAIKLHDFGGEHMEKIQYMLGIRDHHT